MQCQKSVQKGLRLLEKLQFSMYNNVICFKVVTVLFNFLVTSISVCNNDGVGRGIIESMTNLYEKWVDKTCSLYNKTKKHGFPLSYRDLKFVRKTSSIFLGNIVKVFNYDYKIFIHSHPVEKCQRKNKKIKKCFRILYSLFSTCISE